MEINLNVIWWFSCFEYFWNKSLHDIASVSGSKADAVDQVPELQWLSLVTPVTPSGLKEINPNIWGQESKCQLERIVKYSVTPLDWRVQRDISKLELSLYVRILYHNSNCGSEPWNTPDSFWKRITNIKVALPYDKSIATSKIVINVLEGKSYLWVIIEIP